MLQKGKVEQENNEDDIMNPKTAEQINADSDELICRVCRTQMYVHPDCEPTDICDLCAQEKLAEVTLLVEKWRGDAENDRYTTSYNFVKLQCAKELEEALK